MRQRSMILISVIAVAFGASACGRATPDQINQVLGITPTPTVSAAQIASAAAAASATAASQLLAASTPGAVALGDVTKGATQFETWCSGCHSPGGQGPDILAAGSAGASVSADSLLPLVRDGEGHTPPGPYKPTEISDKQVADIAAYIRSNAAK